jgi:hypothetical protein
MRTRSWFGEVNAREGCLLLGATKRHVTSRFSHEVDAEYALIAYMSGNERLVRDFSVRGSLRPPDIARCCEGHPAQAVGFPCFGCGRKVGSRKREKVG